MGRQATLNRRAKIRAAKEMDIKEGEKRLHGLLGKERARVRSNLHNALVVLNNMSCAAEFSDERINISDFNKPRDFAALDTVIDVLKCYSSKASMKLRWISIGTVDEDCVVELTSADLIESTESLRKLLKDPEGQVDFSGDGLKKLTAVYMVLLQNMTAYAKWTCVKNSRSR